MHQRIILVSSVLGLAFGLVGGAQAFAAAALDPASFTPSSELRGPPSPESPASVNDLNEVLKLQGSRTAADCKRAESEIAPSLQSFFGPPYGPLAESDLVKLAPDFGKLLEGLYPLIKKTKEKWTRVRPSQASSQVQTCIKLETSSSYPSGHAAAAVVLGKTLALIRPKLKKVILKRSHQIGEDRVMAGAHYPSDIRDGEILGEEIFSLLQANKEYQEMIARLRL